MINFFWQLFCAMDLDLSNKKRAMEEGPDEEFNALEYENFCTLQLTLEEEWDRLEEINSLKDVREFTFAEQIDEGTDKDEPSPYTFDDSREF